MSVYKNVSLHHLVSIVGIVAVLVILSILVSKDGNPELAEEKTIYPGIVIDDEESAVLGAAATPMIFEEFVGSLPSYGFVAEGTNTYSDPQNGFNLEVENEFSKESESVARLPFYWQERYEGSEFNNGVEMFVVNNEYKSFVSGITYGLGETFITQNEVVVTPRTTGYGDNFVHQAYVDLQNGKTLLLELRTSNSNYPEELKSYIETMGTV